MLIKAQTKRLPFSNKFLAIVCFFTTVSVLTACVANDDTKTAQFAVNETKVVEVETPLTTLSNTQTDSVITVTSFPTIFTTANVQSVTPDTDWQIKWLRGFPCSPPCWEGITPGVTSLQEAINLLKKSPLVQRISVFTKTLNGESYVLWNWNSGKPGGQAYYDPKTTNNVIDSIRPNYTHLLTLNDLIQAFGEPEYVIASFSGGAETTARFYDLHFSYVSKGFSLAASTNGRTYTPSLNLGMYVEQPTFFVPTKNLTEIKTKGAVAWQGFKDFNFYCRDPNHPDKPCT